MQKWNEFIFVFFFLNTSLFDLYYVVPKGSGMVCHILYKNSSLLAWHLSLGVLGLGKIEFEDSCLVVAVLWLLKCCCDYLSALAANSVKCGPVLTDTFIDFDLTPAEPLATWWESNNLGCFALDISFLVWCSSLLGHFSCCLSKACNS